MEYTSIPGISLEVSRIALGTWAIGGWMWGGSDETESIKTIHSALNKGINIIDTAPIYGFGLAEEIVGKAIKAYGHRESIVLATKVGLEWKNEGEKIVRNSSSNRIRQEIEDSLARLKTDYIDLYQVHWPDPTVPIEETAEELNKLKQEGKILACGVSNYSTDQMDRFRKIVPLSSSQSPYNLFERDIDRDIIPHCKQNGIVLLAYGAICRGLLSGKINRKSRFKGDDLRLIDPKFKPPHFQEYLDAVSLLDDFAKQRYGQSVLHLAVRWILDQNVEIAIWGARRPEQLDPLPEMMNWSLPSEDLSTIDRILSETIKTPIKPDFMAPPVREE